MENSLQTHAALFDLSAGQNCVFSSSFELLRGTSSPECGRTRAITRVFLPVPRLLSGHVPPLAFVVQAVI